MAGSSPAMTAGTVGGRGTSILSAAGITLEMPLRQRPACHQYGGGHIHPVPVGQRKRGAGLAGLRHARLEARGTLVRGHAMHDLQVVGRYPARLGAVALRRAADGVERVLACLASLVSGLARRRPLAPASARY